MIPSTPLDDKELRKAWLKRKFVSFEYHEEMLGVHRQWLTVLRKALARAEKDESPNRPNSGYKTIAEEAVHFRGRYMPLIECNDDVGKYRKDEWHKYYATATFRSIPDYSRYLQSEGDFLSWMTPEEDVELGPLWGRMAQMASNIRRTVDDAWFNKRRGNDDALLDEECTGPIDWPSNWRDDVADLAPHATSPNNCASGLPCPREGYWFTPAAANSRRHFKQGDVMPDRQTDFGHTVWQWSKDQS